MFPQGGSEYPLYFFYQSEAPGRLNPGGLKSHIFIVLGQLGLGWVRLSPDNM